MTFHKEKQLLQIIKYAPSLFVIAISIIILSFTYLEQIHAFKNEKKSLKEEFLNQNKDLIKKEVTDIYEYIKRNKETTESDLKKSLNQELQNAYNIANSIYLKNQDKSKDEIKKIIFDALRDIRFNDGRGYFFIYDKSGKNVMHPIIKNFEGKNLINHQDSKGAYVIKDMIELLKTKNTAYYEWYWKRPNDTASERRKIGLVKNFEAFDWLIGTGEYLDDFEKNIQDRLLEHIKNIRYGKNGYIFIISYDSIYLSHIRNSFIGKSAIKNNDTIDIKNVINELIDISKNGEGYYSYIQNHKPGTEKASEKISYVKGLNDWKWIIGTGFYRDDVNKIIEVKEKLLFDKLKKHITHSFIAAFIMTLFLLLISIFFSRKIRDKFNKYKLHIEKHMDDNEKQHNILAQQSKMAAMGEMINNIAHQWRQPLSVISTSATGMKVQKELGFLDDTLLSHGLEEINYSAQYLSKTIDDFRNFFDKNKQKCFFKVENAIEKTILLINSHLLNKNIKIVKKIEDIEINNLENELIQVLINIFNNAVEELVKTNNKDKMIFIKVKKAKSKVIIDIKDNAGGIDEKIIDRIFEPYFTTKHKSQGTGIGLYMCREIVTKHMNGTIEVINSDIEYYNEKYKGALIRIILQDT